MQCHMPTTKTDIPHVAFTHHRIDVYKSDERETDEPNEWLCTLGSV